MDEEIKKLIVKKGEPALYILRLPDCSVGEIKNVHSLYKFGITGDVGTRLTTHLRNLHFVDIVCVVYFNDISDAALVETQIKRFAESVGQRRNLLGNTEIIETCDVSKYIEIVYAGKIARNIENNNQINEKLDEINEKLDEIDEKIENPAEPTINIEIKDNIEVENIDGDINQFIEVNINTEAKNKNHRFKCEDCGSCFKDNAHLRAHKNRKTPCLIKEIPEEHINNPNLCKFCKRVLSKKDNLTRHLKICKLRN
ncbi:E3 ubiquitin-protein ligase [Pacmanvirus S19]|nr:E3 ubiquitin-protein ligase [Pacmanvirus S19]